MVLPVVGGELEWCYQWWVVNWSGVTSGGWWTRVVLPVVGGVRSRWCKGLESFGW